MKIDKQKREDLSLNYKAMGYPGPNKYQYDYQGQSSKTPKWTFSKSERFKTKPKSAFVRRLNVPGPGSYQTQTFIGKDGPIYSFTKDKFNHADAADEAMFKKTKNYPCPGSYSKKTPYVSDTPIYSMSKLERPKTATDKQLLSFPGPDQYNPDKISTMKKDPVWSMGKANRDEDAIVPKSKKKRVMTPGPGHYNIKNGNIGEAPAYTMAKKLNKKQKEGNPGPGEYNIVMCHYENEPKYSIGKEKRKDDKIYRIEKDNFPGPNKYTIKDDKSNIMINFTRDKRYKDAKFIVPGPGKYKIPTAFDYISDYTRQKGIFDPTFKYV